MREFAAYYSIDAAKDLLRDNRYNSGELEISIEDLMLYCHASAVAGGWYQDPKTKEPSKRNFGEIIALIHSELSEALEGARQDLQSDKIPKFTAVEEELADALIRIFDVAGALNLHLGAAFIAKFKYNQTRPDHKLENRAEGGKQF